MKKKILVTGAAGFIGSYLTRYLLARGDDVIGIDNFSDYYPRKAKEFNLDLTRAWINEKVQNTPSKELEPILKLFEKYYGAKPKNPGRFGFVESDIRDQASIKDIFEKEKPTHIVHLAAMAGVGLSVEDPVLYADVNIMGSMNLLDLCRKYKVEKFVFASSSSVYGDRENFPFKETENVDEPVSPYAATKRMQEIMNYTFNYLYNIPIVNVRVFGPIYGPLQRPYRMVAQRFINLTYHDKEMTIFGDGKEGARDTTYIDDEVIGLVKVMDSDLQYDTINIGSGKAISPKEVADMVIKLMGKGKITYIDRPAGEAPLTYADTRKATSILDFKAKTEFDEGLGRQIETFLAMPKWYKDMEC